MEFEWDERKAKENVEKHDGVSFEEATLAFYDDWAIDEFDDEHSNLTMSIRIYLKKDMF